MSIIGKIFESNFLVNLFGDTNVVRIFYNSNQTYDSMARHPWSSFLDFSVSARRQPDRAGARRGKCFSLPRKQQQPAYQSHKLLAE
jgi:hypothetical protein